MKKVICPVCGELIEYFEHIGVEENRVCPLCKGPIPLDAVPLEVVEESKLEEIE